MKQIILLPFFFFSFTNGYAQTTNFIWAKKVAGVGEQAGNSVVADGAGNVYTTGYFNGTTDFDPGAGVFNLTAIGGDDAFILKLDINGNFVWAKQLGGSGGDNGICIAMDPTGNIYTTGNFNGTVDFDPGPGVFNLTDMGGSDIYIEKLDAAGNFIWAKQYGGTSGEYVNSIAVDLNSNIITTGGFFGTTDFDPGVAVVNLVNGSSGDTFIAKLDDAGIFVWAKQIGGSNALDNTFGYSLKTDVSGNVITAGSFSGTVDFDPGAGTANLNAVGADVFIVKLDAAGNYVWVKPYTAATGFDYLYSYQIALDATGNIYSTGFFGGTIDFNPGAGVDNLTSTASSDDIYVAKLDAAGNYVWAKQLGGTAADYGYAISVDGTGNVYTTGYFTNSADFDPGAGIFNLTSTSGTPDIFIAKLDAAGDFAWAKKMGSTNFDIGNGITVDLLNNVYTTGSFKNTVDFDPDAGIFTISSSGSSDMFVQKLSQIIALPVTLLSFTGSSLFTTNLLQWKTSGEINNAYFILEKSANGIQFSVLDTINGVGNSNNMINYNYVDYNPLRHLTYYRLKQVNFNGFGTYSLILSIANSKTNTAILSNAFPNPATNLVSFNLFAEKEEKVNIHIINNSGIMVQTTFKNIAKGNNGINLPVSGLSKGIYNIKIIFTTTGKTAFVKMIKN